VSAIPADLSLFGKGQRLGVIYPASPQGESDKSGGSATTRWGTRGAAVKP